MSVTQFRNKIEKSMRHIFLGLAIVMLLGMITLFSVNPVSRGQQPEQAARDVTAFKVNGRPITWGDFNGMSQMMANQFGQRMTETQMRALAPFVMMQLVNLEVAAQTAEQNGVKVSGGDIQRLRDEMVKEEFNRYKAAVGQGSMTDEQFEKFLKDGGEDVNRIKEEMGKLYTEGLLKRMAASRIWQEQEKAKVTATEQALRDSYKQYTCRHILFTTKKRSDAQAKVLADRVLQMAKGGKDFAALAKEYSDEPGAKTSGGAIPPGTPLVSDFQKALEKLKPGEISPQPVKTNFGWHIIKLEKVELKLPPDFEKSKSQLMEAYRQRQASMKISEMVAKAQEKVKVEGVLPQFVAIVALQDAQKDPAKSKAIIAKALPGLLKEAQKQDAGDPQNLWNYILQMYKLQNDEVGIIKASEQVMQTAGEPRVGVELAKLYLKRKNTEKALYWLKYVGERSQADPNVLKELAKELAPLGEKQLADQYLQRANLILDQQKKAQAEQQRRIAEQVKKQEEEAKKKAAAKKSEASKSTGKPAQKPTPLGR
jgi:peptidyl-prolyl cis-trans isomerase C